MRSKIESADEELSMDTKQPGDLLMNWQRIDEGACKRSSDLCVCVCGVCCAQFQTVVVSSCHANLRKRSCSFRQVLLYSLLRWNYWGKPHFSPCQQFVCGEYFSQPRPSGKQQTSLKTNRKNLREILQIIQIIKGTKTHTQKRISTLFLKPVLTQISFSRACVVQEGASWSVCVRAVRMYGKY